MRAGLRLPLLLVCFLLSGFAGLVYQTAWAQELALVFGTTELALVTVLAAYMTGLAVGAAVAGRLAYRVRRPLWAYAWLELGIGVAALAVPFGVAAAGRLHAALLGGHDLPARAESVGSALFYLAASFAILLVPTALLGATLPLVTRRLVTRDAEIAPRVGLLYAANTVGAAAGAVAAAFLLLPRLGLGHTVWAAAAVNALVFALAAVLAARSPEEPAAAGPAAEPALPPRAGHWILPLMLLSGAVSFTWEVQWTRLLVHLLGDGVRAFAVMLALFLAGLALGSALASRLGRSARRATTVFALAQLAVAVLFLAAFAASGALAGLARGVGEPRFLLRGLGLAAPLLLPGAIAIGATFPLAVRILARDAADAARASARVFAWNTTGAIAGALVAGYLLLPGAGFAGTAALATAASLCLAILAALAGRPRRWAVAAAAAAVLLALPWVRPATPWRVIRHSPLLGRQPPGEVVHFAVGRSATVLLTAQHGRYRLTTNGLPESTIRRPGGRPGRSVVARWLSLAPLLARPDARSMLVVGLGGGITVEDLPATLEEVRVVELEPEVVRANLAVAGDRAADPLADPRLTIHLNDARGALRLTGRRFDAVVSQPSHPWTSGSSNLFTREFFLLVRDHLAPTGVFAQWMGYRFVDAELLRSLVATATAVFPHVEVYEPVPGMALVLSSTAPLDVAATAPRALAAARRQWRELGVVEPADAVVARVLDGEGARAFARGGRLSTDYHNLFRTRSALVLARPLLAAGADRLLAPHQTAVTPGSDAEGLYLVRRLIRCGDLSRARRLSEELSEAAARHTGGALVDGAEAGRRTVAIAGLRRALKIDPGAAEARAALLELHRVEIEGGRPAPRLAAPIRGAESAVVEGWRLGGAGDWRAVRALEDRLAAVGPRHPLHGSALRLRAGWRAHSGEARLAAAALELLTPLLAPAPRPEDLLLRAAAASAAGRPRSALDALDEALSVTVRPAVLQAVARRARRVLRSLPADPGTADWRRSLEERIERLAAAGSRAPAY